jgi:hypothetical protein
MVLTTVVLKNYSWTKTMWGGEILMNASKKMIASERVCMLALTKELQHEKSKGSIAVGLDALS